MKMHSTARGPTPGLIRAGILRPKPRFSAWRRPLAVSFVAGLKSRRTSRRATLVCKAFGKAMDGGDSSHKSFSHRRRELLEFVHAINPTPEGSKFYDQLPPMCLSACRQTVTNLLGTLPPQFFKVSISTRGDNLGQLMFSVLMTGYLFAAAATRLELAQHLGLLSSGTAPRHAGQLVGSASGSMDDLFAPPSPLAAGSQKVKVQGEVLRWHHEDGLQNIPAVDYIEQLEDELASLRRQLDAQAARAAAPSISFPDDLLEYLRGLTQEQIAELTDSATPDVLEAMNALVERLMGAGEEGEEWGAMRSESTAMELAQLLYWLMAVGHQLRAMEVKLGLRAALDSPAVGGADDGSSGSGGGGGSGGWGGFSPGSGAPRLPPPR